MVAFHLDSPAVYPSLKYTAQVEVGLESIHSVRVNDQVMCAVSATIIVPRTHGEDPCVMASPDNSRHITLPRNRAREHWHIGPTLFWQNPIRSSFCAHSWWIVTRSVALKWPSISRCKASTSHPCYKKKRVYPDSLPLAKSLEQV